MKNLKKHSKINLEKFIDKVRSLENFLESSSKLNIKTRENIYWYCRYRKKQYYEKYINKKNLL